MAVRGPPAVPPAALYLRVLCVKATAQESGCPHRLLSAAGVSDAPRRRVTPPAHKGLWHRSTGTAKPRGPQSPSALSPRLGTSWVLLPSVRPWGLPPVSAAPLCARGQKPTRCLRGGQGSGLPALKGGYKKCLCSSSSRFEQVSERKGTSKVCCIAAGPFSDEHHP